MQVADDNGTQWEQQTVNNDKQQSKEMVAGYTAGNEREEITGGEEGNQ